MNHYSLYIEQNSPWFLLQYWKSRAQRRYHMKLTKNTSDCNHMPKLQGKWRVKQPLGASITENWGRKTDFTRFSLEMRGERKIGGIFFHGENNNP